MEPSIESQDQSMPVESSYPSSMVFLRHPVTIAKPCGFCVEGVRRLGGEGARGLPLAGGIPQYCERNPMLQDGGAVAETIFCCQRAGRRICGGGSTGARTERAVPVASAGVAEKLLQAAFV